MELNTTPTPNDALDASYDIVARQDPADTAIATRRTDVDEVKARLDRVSLAASRPALSASASDSADATRFVDGYLRQGRETEVKSINGAAGRDGGYAVPRAIDAMIARELVEISPIRALAQVVQTGTSGYRKLIATGGTASGWSVCVQRVASSAGRFMPRSSKTRKGSRSISLATRNTTAAMCLQGMA